jgi:hypothetical protein
MRLRRLLAAAGCAAAVALAAPALAAPLTLWLEPSAGIGLDSAAASAAQGAGLSLLPDSTFFSNTGATHLTVTTPPSIPKSDVHFVKKPKKSDPIVGHSTWTVTAVDRAYSDLWIVIQGHDPNDPNAAYYRDSSKIGLVVDPADTRWALVHPAGSPGVTYLAYFVGDLVQGGSYDVPISYAVAKALKLVKGSKPKLCLFPQYRVNFLELAVPEPVAIGLLAFGGGLLAIRKRSRAR